MIDYLTVSLFVYGVSCVINGFEEFFGLDFDKTYRLSPKWQKFIMKPTIYCNVCMSSFWGVIGYFLVFDSFSLSQLILSCVISAGFITIINKFQ